jgi:toxin ParE1/3/4
VLQYLAQIAENPLRYSARGFDVHRANLSRFPFNVNYIIGGDDIIVVAIAHERREPFYWLYRTQK